MSIHKTAIIAKNAQIDCNVKIEAFVQISSNVSIKKGCHIASGAILLDGVNLDENNYIGAYSILGQKPQIRDYQMTYKECLKIGKNNYFGEYNSISLGSSKDEFITEVGDDNYLMNNCHLGHDVRLSNGNTISSFSGLAGHVNIGNFSTIGGFSAIHQFVRIGDFTMIGIGATVVQDIAHFCLASGNRASIKSLNLNALRKNFNQEQINGLKFAFKSLFNNNRPLKTIIQEYKTKYQLQEDQGSLISKLFEFILNSKRGVAKKFLA